MRIDENLFGLIVAGTALICLVIGALAGVAVSGDEPTEPWWAGPVFALWFVGMVVSSVGVVAYVSAGFIEGLG